MPESLRIKIDPLNPGHFFACCGLFELLNFDEPGLLSRFEYDSQLPRAATFCLKMSSHDNSIKRILGGLHDAPIHFPEDDTDIAVKPATIEYADRTVELDWWLDKFRADKTRLKGWGGRVTIRSLLTELSGLLDPESTAQDLFQRSSLTKSKFGVDPRSAWNTLDLGFSPDKQDVSTTVFPAVEILAAVGLQCFRPEPTNRNIVRYALWLDDLPAAVARLAFLDAWDGLAALRLQFEIVSRGQGYKCFAFARIEE